MHELTLMEEVRRLLEVVAQEQGLFRIHRVVLDIGELAGVEPEAMTFCFDAVMADSLAEGAELEIRRSPGQAWCEICQAEVRITNRVQSCPQCSGVKLRILKGDRVQLLALEGS